MDVNPSAETDGPPLTERQLETLANLLTQAQRHDVVVERAYRAVREAVGGQTMTAGPDQIETLLDGWQDAITELHLRIGAAARAAAVHYEPLSPRDDWSISGLHGDELQAVLKPLFEQSGIPDRFFRHRPS
ncbi:MAG: hypothetical protein ABR525_11695 [Candidatus Limnocylindria bacterium]